MLVSDFDYVLPEELIAQEPLADRSASCLLHLDKQIGTIEDRYFREFPELLTPDDLVVFNNTRVFPARLYGRRSGSKAQTLSPRNPASREFLRGTVEVLLTKQISADPYEWECLVRPGRKIGVGEQLFFDENASPSLQAHVDEPGRASAPSGQNCAGWEPWRAVPTRSPVSGQLVAEVVGRGAFGERLIRFEPVPDFFERIEELGHVPLPPYISREDRPGDRERYQTVYARERGSVAAPTAGLHFTPEILARMQQRGIETAEITLHVGLGTFQPVRTDRVEKHKLHSERFNISEEAAERINRALEHRRRIVAVGTTTVRTLEYAARDSGRVRAGNGEADLFIYPGFQFRVVGALLTNFHLPQSTLLMLVCAFGGKEKVMAAYQHAVEQRYRFYSYGDCMFVD